MKSEFKFQFILYCAIACLLIFISTKVQTQLDFSKNKVFTLDKYTNEVLVNLDTTISIQWIRSNSLSNYVPAIKYIETIFEQLQRSENCIFEIIDAEKLSSTAITSLQLYPVQIKTGSQTEQTFTTLYSGIIIEYNGFTKIIPYVFDMEKLEYTIVNNTLALIQDSKNISFRRNIYILTFPNGTQEDYVNILPYLEYENFICQLVNDDEIETLDNKIPLVVIGSSFLTDAQITQIDSFIASGGNVAFFVSGNTINVNGNWEITHKQNDKLLLLLAKYGFIINEDVLTDIFYSSITMMSEDGMTTEVIPYPFWVRINPEQTDLSQPFFAGYNTLQSFWPSSIDLENEEDKTLRPVLTTSTQSKRLIENIITDPFAFSSDDIKSIKPSKSTIAATSTMRGRIFVFADEYFLSRCIEYTGSDANIETLTSVCHWLIGNDSLLQLKNKQSSLLPFKTFDNNQQTERIITIARTINIFVIPILIVVIACLLLVSKRKKNKGV